MNKDDRSSLSISDYTNPQEPLDVSLLLDLVFIHDLRPEISGFLFHVLVEEQKDIINVEET